MLFLYPITPQPPFVSNKTTISHPNLKEERRRATHYLRENSQYSLPSPSPNCHTLCEDVKPNTCNYTCKLWNERLVLEIIEIIPKPSSGFGVSIGLDLRLVSQLAELPSASKSGKLEYKQIYILGGFGSILYHNYLLRSFICQVRLPRFFFPLQVFSLQTHLVFMCVSLRIFVLCDYPCNM